MKQCRCTRPLERRGKWTSAAGATPAPGDNTPSALCGLTLLYSLRQHSISTVASNSASKIVPLSSSSRSQFIVSQGRVVSNGNIEHPRQSFFRIAAPHRPVEPPLHTLRGVFNSDSGSNTVTRFPASDPGNAEQIEVGFAPRAVAIDSLGNAWVANTVGHPGTQEKLELIEAKLESKFEGLGDSVSKDDIAIKMWIDLFDLLT